MTRDIHPFILVCGAGSIVAACSGGGGPGPGALARVADAPAFAALAPPAHPARDQAWPSSAEYMPVITPPFTEIFARLTAAKPALMERQLALMASRYDLSDRPARGVTMSRGKPVQEGVRVRLPPGVTWAMLAAMSPAEIRAKDLWPAGFYPLPHTNQVEGGFVFPRVQIDETKKQEGRDLTRFDLDFDTPDAFLPELPPAIYLTSRKDLGDVSRGKLVTNQNFFELFEGIVSPRELDGLRLLVTPFPQQQFNLTSDRRSERPSTGATCFDCHANGHTNGAYHLAPDARPEAYRHRINTPTLRGVNMQRLFGSQRALKTIEDFTEFEQRGAYFDGDHVIGAKKGLNILDRGAQVANMAGFQELLDFPPAPKLRPVDMKLDPARATQEELRGQAVFFGKGQCANCHAAPIYSDNFSHDLETERFYTPREINGQVAAGDGPIKTFPLRGIKDSPPYLHDGRLLTLDDTIEFFNLVLELKLSDGEKRDLLAFLYVL